MTHKFRAAIGKTKLVRDGETMLVAFSGGPASAALVSLIQEVGAGGWTVVQASQQNNAAYK